MCPDRTQRDLTPILGREARTQLEALSSRDLQVSLAGPIWQQQCRNGGVLERTTANANGISGPRMPLPGIRSRTPAHSGGRTPQLPRYEQVVRSNRIVGSMFAS